MLIKKRILFIFDPDNPISNIEFHNLSRLILNKIGRSTEHNRLLSFGNNKPSKQNRGSDRIKNEFQYYSQFFFLLLFAHSNSDITVNRFIVIVIEFTSSVEIQQ